jgi:DnaJ-class molecular chaperone
LRVRYCYEILGITNSASEKEIDAAYRDLVRRHHPDLGGDAKEFKKITHAYERLKIARICEDCQGTGKHDLTIYPFSFVMPCEFCDGNGRSYGK